MFVLLNMKITVKNLNKSFEVKGEKTLLEFLINNNVKIKANCEGNCACGQCLVEFDKDIYDKMNISDEEYDIIEKQLNKTKYTRLACQVKIEDFMNDCWVRIL